MDVINFSGGGPQTDPVNDAIVRGSRQRRGRRRRPGHLGRQRPRRLRPRHRGVAEHRAGRDLRRGGLEQPGLLAGAERHCDRCARVARARRLSTGRWRPDAGVLATANETLVDVGSRRRPGPAGRPPSSAVPIRRIRAGRRRRSAVRRSRARSPSSTAARAASYSKAGRAVAAGAIGIVVVDNRPGEANVIPIQLAGAGRDDRPTRTAPRCVATWRRRAAARPSASARAFEDIPTGRSGVVT